MLFPHPELLWSPFPSNWLLLSSIASSQKPSWKHPAISSLAQALPIPCVSHSARPVLEELCGTQVLLHEWVVAACPDNYSAPIYRCRNWESEVLSDSPKVMSNHVQRDNGPREKSCSASTSILSPFLMVLPSPGSRSSNLAQWGQTLVRTKREDIFHNSLWI